MNQIELITAPGKQTGQKHECPFSWLGTRFGGNEFIFRCEIANYRECCDAQGKPVIPRARVLEKDCHEIQQIARRNPDSHNIYRTLDVLLRQRTEISV
ncbi:hypothetical protein ISS86_00410 [Candidatus Microgenomates bacterium]|nr:hypothetical protein [Candidatus Microgenomates bacterium]